MNTAPNGRLRYVAPACYLLLLAVWVADLFTPQLFIAAILMNAPIALSSLTLRRGLTIRLLVLAELANLSAGYVNGAQAQFHWNAVALGDRTLLAASFLLVGYLTLQSQTFARAAGAASLRETQMRNEQALRRAIGRVRSSLSVELVRHAIVLEAVQLFDASRAVMYRRRGILGPVETLTADSGATDVSISRDGPPAEAASVMNRFGKDSPAQTTFVTADDSAGRVLLDAWNVRSLLAGRIVWNGEEEALLFILPADARSFGGDSEPAFQAFVSQAETALSQSALFERLARQNEEILERKNVIRDIVYALAHDIRTPLAAASTTMRQALGGAFGPLPEQYANVLRATIASNEELRELAETLLLVARYEVGEASNHAVRVNMGDLCAAVESQMQATALERSITLSVHDRADDRANVLGDPGELRRAVVNLIANAFAATPRGGAVTITISAEDAQVCVEVRDDGYGVPEERRRLLFGRFQSAPLHSGGGTGLGLYLVRRIAEKYGGTIEYRPAPDRGSIFTMKLPRDEGRS